MLYNYGAEGVEPRSKCAIVSGKITVLLCSVSRSVGFAADYDCSGSSTTTQQGGFLLETTNMKGQLILQKGVVSHDTPTMSSREIAELTGKRHDNVVRTCRSLKASGVTPQIEESTFDHLGNTYIEFRLNKRDSLVLVARLSPEFTAAVIDRWQELEQDPVAPAPANLSDTMQAAVILLESAKRNLNLSNSSMLGGYQKLQAMAGLPNLMPSYAIDAPADAVDGSSRSTSALRTLLQQRDFPVKVQAAYQRLQELGIVQRMTRPSTKGEKQFWSITPSGLMFGKNMTSPGNPRETQPHFYDSRADELVAMILGDAK